MYSWCDDVTGCNILVLFHNRLLPRDLYTCHVSPPMDTAPCWPQTKLRLKGALIIFVYTLRKHAWKDQWDGHRKEIKSFKNFKTLPLSSLVLERSRAENMPWLALLMQLDTTWHLWKKNSQTDSVQSRQTATRQKMTEFRILLLDTWQSRIHLVVAPFHHSPLNTSAQRTITPRLFKTRTVCAKVPLPIQAKKTRKEHEEFQWNQPMELTQHSTAYDSMFWSWRAGTEVIRWQDISGNLPESALDGAAMYCIWSKARQPSIRIHAGTRTEICIATKCQFWRVDLGDTMLHAATAATTGCHMAEKCRESTGQCWSWHCHFPPLGDGPVQNQGNLQEFSFFSRLLTLGSKIPQLVPNGLSRQVMGWDLNLQR